MPSEIIRMVKFRPELHLSEVQYQVLEEMGRAENMTVDQEITEIVKMGLRAAVEICDGMTMKRKYELYDKLRDE